MDLSHAAAIFGTTSTYKPIDVCLNINIPR